MSNHPLHRRRFLQLGAAGAAALATARIAPAAAQTAPDAGASGARPSWRIGYPFTLGVASGDPTHDSVVLWTRLAPDPLAGGGMPAHPVPVQWEIARDDRFRHVVARGTQWAVPEVAHSVHAEVGGLRSDEWYWYRFKAGRELSPVGRTRTAPRQRGRTRSLAFAFASCQNFPDGFYTAYRHMAAEDLDVVLHLGDYIYEGVSNPAHLRPHEGTTEPLTLDGYRNRHAQYKTDPDLQAAHAAFPWLVVPDDHEIDNNWADEIPQDPALQPPDAFLARRAAAFQAYYEHMPFRTSSVPVGIDMQIFRRISFGDLADFHMLDTRQYRSDQNQSLRLDPARTLLGDQQEQWLLANLAGRTARWNVLGQQVFFSQRDFTSGPLQSFSDDAWDNYVADRNTLRDHIVAVGTSNPVVLTGDVHASYVCDVKANFDDPASATVATELVGTSISTGGDGVEQNPGDAVQLTENPHIRYINRKRGYVRNTLTRDAWTADFRVVEQVRVADSPIATRATFVIEEGVPGAVPA